MFVLQSSVSPDERLLEFIAILSSGILPSNQESLQHVVHLVSCRAKNRQDIIFTEKKLILNILL